MLMVAQVDEQCVLSDVGWYAFELESLVTSPSKKGRVRGSELAKILRHPVDMYVGSSVGRGLFHVLANWFVRWPVNLLAVL